MEEMYPGTLPLPTLPPAENLHIVVPLMSFVLGFPVLVISLLCLIQQRNKAVRARALANARHSLQRGSLSASAYG